MSKLFDADGNFELALTRAMKMARVPGAAMLIIRNGQVESSKGHGIADPETGQLVTPDTIFTIASVSKTVTAAALMTLYEKDKLSLDDDVSAYLPFMVRNPNSPSSGITFRMLLTHTSSIVDSDTFWNFYTLKKLPVLPDSPISLGDFLKDYLGPKGKLYDPTTNFLNDRPGMKYTYSNIGFGLIGYLVECISGMPFAEYCKLAIFDPLGMKRTCWLFKDVDLNQMAVPYGYDDLYQPIRYGFYSYPTYPDGALKTSVNEFARFVSLFINNGKTFEGNGMLRPETIKEILTHQRFCGMDNGESTGLAWHFDGEVYNHDGRDPGISTMVCFKLETRQGMIFFCNGSNFDLMNVSSLKALRQDLLDMVEEDRRVRAELARNGLIYDGYHPKIKAIHDRNADKLREIIKQVGWPTIGLVGEDGSDAAWFILQHAIDHPDLLRSAIFLLKTASEKGEINPQNYAYLYDRICMYEGRPQFYGTQFDFDAKGEYIPWEIEDEGDVDARRLKIGLPTLQETWMEHKRQFKEEETLPLGWNKKEWDENFKEWAKKSGWRS